MLANPLAPCYPNVWSIEEREIPSLGAIFKSVDQVICRSAGFVFHGPFDLTLAFAVLDGVTLVMLRFAFGQRNFKLDFAVFPVHVQGHQGVTLLLDFAHQAHYFCLVEEQLFGPVGFGHHVGGRRAGGVDLAADHKKLAFANHHIPIGELNPAVPDGLDLPSVQDHARLIALFNEIIEDGLFVVCDARRRGGFGAHGIKKDALG